MTSINNPNTPPSVAVPITDEGSSIVQRNSDIPILHLEDEREEGVESTKEKKARVKHWVKRQWKEIFYEPKGVRLRHYFIVKWLGRIGFIAKGIVYAVMGGLCIRTAQQLVGDITGTESPMVCVIPCKNSYVLYPPYISFVGSVHIFRHVLYRHTYSYHHVYRALVLLHVEIVSLLFIFSLVELLTLHMYFF